MTVSSSSNRIPYTGDGVTVAFATPYFLSNADIKAYVDGSLKVLTTDYTLSGAGTSTGGTITFLSAPAAGKSVIILRDADQLQATSLPSNDPFPSKSVETALDKLTMLVQRCRDLLGRSFTLSDSDTSGASLTVPTPSALKFLRWNSGATALESVDIASAGSLGLPVAVSQGGTNATTAAGARSNLGAVGVAGDQMTGALKFTAGRNNIASAATVNLSAATSNTAHITGTTGISAFTMTSGQEIDVVFDGALTLTHHATNNNLPGATNITTAAGDRARYWYDGTTVWCLVYQKADGTAITGGTSSGMCLGTFRNLAISTTGTNASITCSADEVVVENASNQYMTLRSWSRTINSAASGAVDALDTGSVAGSTWYSVWAIAKADGTQGGLLSTSATAPTLPSGYTYKARVGWIRTDATGNKYPLSFKQFGRKATYVIAAGSNVTAYPNIATGTSGTFSAGTYTPTTQSVSSFVPSTASHIRLYFNSQRTEVSAAVTPNGAASWTGYGSNPAPEISFYGGASVTTFTTDMMLESTNIYWANNTGASFVMACGGWEDNL